MFNLILAAIDLSPANKHVFHQAKSLAQANQASLILLHVLSMEEDNSPLMSPYLVYHKERCLHLDPQILQQANQIFEQEWSNFKAQGIKLLRSFADEATSAGIKTESTQIPGHPSSTICDFAQSCHADLLVIGRRGFCGWKEMFLGSVSNYVVHHAPCSVLLVQTPIPEDLASAEKKETKACA